MLPPLLNNKPATKTMTDKQLREVLWNIALSDHLGDVADAIRPICRHFGIRKEMCLEELMDEMTKRKLEPNWAKDDN